LGSQKEAIVARIAGDGCAPNKAWRPAWMQMPPTRVLEGAPSQSADCWEKVAELFEGDDAEQTGVENQSDESAAA